MPTDTCTDPVGSRKVRPVHRQPRLEHTGRVNRCKSWCIKAKCVVTWERRTSGTHFKPIERSLSVYLAKFWGFARLGPTTCSPTSVEPSMPVSVGWKWKVGAYRHA